MPIRTASARWQGTLTEGSGAIRTGKGGLTGSYSFKSRFEEGEGTNPEELVGAAHAACFSMALAKLLADAGYPPTSIDTAAEVYLDRMDGAMTVTRIQLNTTGHVPNIEAGEFAKHAETAKATCPISRALAATEISLNAVLAP
jgi:osmotically inducible protein OsmC